MASLSHAVDLNSLKAKKMYSNVTTEKLSRGYSGRIDSR